MIETIDFLICNYNGDLLLKKCIDSIIRLKLTHFKIYVYDNDSKDESIESIKNYRSEVVSIIEGKDNIGYGKAINRIFDMSNSKYIFILNPDSELEFSRNKLELLMSNFGDKLIFGFDIVNNDGTNQNFLTYEPDYKWIVGGLLRIGFPIVIEPFYRIYFSLLHSKMNNNVAQKSNNLKFVSGCALLMTRESFRQIGKFNEEYFLYFEDTELLFNANKLGFDIEKSELKVKHTASYSFRKASNRIKAEKYKSALIYFKNTRGYIYYLWVKFCLIFFSILSLLNPINIFYRNLGKYFTNLIVITFKN